MNAQYAAVSKRVLPKCEIVLVEIRGREQLQIVRSSINRNVLFTFSEGAYFCPLLYFIMIIIIASDVNLFSYFSGEQTTAAVNALQWCFGALKEYPAQLHAIDVGGPAEQAIADPMHMPSVPLFSGRCGPVQQHPGGAIGALA